jgi:hypothetical protein
VHEWLGWTNEPNHSEDVTSDFDTKVTALAEGIRFFENFTREKAAEAGKKIGVDLAEEFRVLDLS